MKLKLDENLGHSAANLFRQAGHVVAMVRAQSLSGFPDEDVLAVCQREGRCLVTLDLEFGNPLLFKPSEYAGIAVLHLPPKRRRVTCCWPAEPWCVPWDKTRSRASFGASNRGASANTVPTG